LDGVEWNEEEVKVSLIPRIDISCLADRLSSVTVVPRNKKVWWSAIFFYSECVGINIQQPYD
jgi:hypothetical protein